MKFTLSSTLIQTVKPKFLYTDVLPNWESDYLTIIHSVRYIWSLMYFSTEKKCNFFQLLANLVQTNCRYLRAYFS